MSCRVDISDLELVLLLADQNYDGTDYHFDRLAPSEQDDIVAAARAVITASDMWLCSYWGTLDHRQECFNDERRNLHEECGRVRLVPVCELVERELT
jgi:hypothetical protein